jgi:hypothetical protein
LASFFFLFVLAQRFVAEITQLLESGSRGDAVVHTMTPRSRSERSTAVAVVRALVARGELDEALAFGRARFEANPGVADALIDALLDADEPTAALTLMRELGTQVRLRRSTLNNLLRAVPKFQFTTGDVFTGLLSTLTSEARVKSYRALVDEVLDRYELLDIGVNADTMLALSSAVLEVRRSIFFSFVRSFVRLTPKCLFSPSCRTILTRNKPTTRLTVTPTTLA